MDINKHPQLHSYMVVAYATERVSGARHQLSDTLAAADRIEAGDKMIDLAHAVGYRDVRISLIRPAIAEAAA